MLSFWGFLNDELCLAEIVNKSNERLRVSIQPVYNFQWLEKIFRDEHIGGITLNPGLITLRWGPLNSEKGQFTEGWSCSIIFKLSPHRPRKVPFSCNHGLGDLQKLSAYSLDRSITHFLDEQIEAGRVYHLMQEYGVYFIEGNTFFESSTIKYLSCRNWRNTRTWTSFDNRSTGSAWSSWSHWPEGINRASWIARTTWSYWSSRQGPGVGLNSL